MKILQVINNLGSGGAEKLISEYVPKMIELGHEVEVLLIRDKNSIYTNQLLIKSIKVSALNKSSLYNPFTAIKLYRYLKINRYDIIHVHLFPSIYFFYIASLFLTNTKKVFTEHAVSNDRQKFYLFRFIDSIIYNKFNKIICLSSAVLKNLTSKINIDNKKCVIIPNGINLESFKLTCILKRNELSDYIKIDDFLIIMIARLTYQKDHNTLLKALSILPQRFKLLLVGEGENKDEISNQINSLNLQERVFLLGRRTDVPELISICDLGVLSSRVEGMPLFALEVMASKKPFVGSDVPGISDLFKEAGIIFKFGDYKELASIISNLADNRDLYKQYSVKSLEFSKKYSIEQMASNYLDLYNKILHNEKDII